MFSKDKGIVVVLIGIVLGLLFIVSDSVTDGFHNTTIVEAGSMSIPFTGIIDVETALTASTTITDGNYDSFDSPLGTSFVGDSVKEFTVGGFSLTSSTTDIRIDYGFGTSHVENSVSAPTDDVIVGSFVIPASSGLERVPVFWKVPVNAHPFVRVVGSDSNGHVTLIGVFDD